MRRDVTGITHHELMSDGQSGNRWVSQHIEHAHKRFEKVHDEVWTVFLDVFSNEAQARPVIWNAAKHVPPRVEEGDATVVLQREGRAGHALDFYVKRLLKERRQGPLQVAARQDRCYLMAALPQHLVDCDRLGHMAATLALHCEHDLHDNESA